MEFLLGKRKSLRQSFTITASALDAEILKPDVEVNQLQVLSSQLEGSFNRLDEVQSQISELLLKSVNEKNKKVNSTPVITPGTLKNSTKRNFKLPKLDLQKFNGETRNWLGFWRQFKKIHEDVNIDDDDKSQYLLQATIVGSPARELIDSYLPSGGNYKEAIKQLKSRFARDELLVEIYVRELLKLALAQARKKGNMVLSNLYDKLETQLRALETLGVKREIYAAMLYSLVESSLPEEILRAWERSRQLESEKRLQLARTRFSAPDKFDSVLATAACIYAGDSKKKQLNFCDWCDKETHNSYECFKLHSLSLEDKKNLLRKKKACFNCLKIGHAAEKCKSSVKCLFCNKRHVTVMCKDLKGSRSSRKEALKVANETTETLLSNQKLQTSLLQNIMVKIVHNGKKELVRTLFDSGSQRSYLRKDIMKKLDLVPLDQQTLSHNLFVGVETESQVHIIVDIEIQGTENKFNYELSVLHKDKIFVYIPRVKLKHICSLREHKIKISDSGRDTPDIGLLIGADYSG
ncbi:uncharacterized protein LOC118193241 [Stegodyphus dumicola]|uniref:uncharacterized protein LOC118193241 n=1 Tax=Stegodyphus dumicola TaxID=202533 RepID=UPI0015ACDFF1|nr:uncharacterized protein LOC118193241 [Stegodyphus dumicola]